MAVRKVALGQTRRRISPAGVDVITEEQVMTPLAASLAIRDKGSGPLVLTQDEIDIYEAMALREKRRG